YLTGFPMPGGTMAEDVDTQELLARARAAFGRDAYLAALADLQEVARREPFFADVHNLIGLCLALLGRPEEAVGAFDRAVGINPRYVEAHVNRAITLNELGRYAEARSSFERAAEADVEEGVRGFPSALAARLANKHLELGDLYAEGGALAEAAEQYRRGCEIRPRFVDIRGRLGRALIELGEVGAAVRELREVVGANPSFLAARMDLGLALHRAGDAAAAREQWERCLAQQPGNAQAQAYLAMLERE